MEVAPYRKRWRHVFLYSCTPRFFFGNINISIPTYATTHPRPCGGGDKNQRKSRSTQCTESRWRHRNKYDATGTGPCGHGGDEKQQKSRSTRSTENGDVAGRRTTQHPMAHNPATPWRTTQPRPGAQPRHTQAHNPAAPWRRT